MTDLDLFVISLSQGKHSSHFPFCSLERVSFHFGNQL